MNEGTERHLQQQVEEALREGQSLCPSGGGSKAFYGRDGGGQPLVTTAHKGVVQYDPTELVVTARAGTPLADLEELLAIKGQMLGFEPPRFGGAPTLGGVIAAGLAGPRRPFAGAPRDFVLGLKLLNGRGQVLRFGGQVMKNVAGFDISRLVTGSLGTLGLILEVSLKVLPRPRRELTLVLPHPEPADAIAAMSRFAGQPLPLSAACWHDGELRVRLSGSEAGVGSAARQIGGEPDSLGDRFWTQLRDHELPFFRTEQVLYRASMPPASEMCFAGSPQVIDWGGAQRWVCSDEPPETVRKALSGYRANVTVFRGGDRGGSVFHPLEPVLAGLHARVKQAFDPAGLFSPGRLYPEM